MKCEQAREWLDDYHYGELESGPAAQVAEHLGSCSGCRSELELLERESRIFEAYASKTESAVELSPDLWRRALARAAGETGPAGNSLSGKTTVSWWSRVFPSPWLRQAVAAILLVGLSISGTLLVVNYYRKDGAPESQPAAAAANAKTLEAALQSIQNAEQAYLNAIRDLSDVVEKRKTTLDPRIVAELQASMRLIDEHIAAARKAYYAHPDDAELALHMLAAYGRKVEILQDLTAS